MLAFRKMPEYQCLQAWIRPYGQEAGLFNHSVRLTSSFRVFTTSVSIQKDGLSPKAAVPLLPSFHRGHRSLHDSQRVTTGADVHIKMDG